MTAEPKLALPLGTNNYIATDADIERFADEEARGMAPPQTPLLNMPAHPVPEPDITSNSVQQVIKRLLQVARGQRARRSSVGGKKRTLVGLAAPQIGEPLQIIVVDTKMTPDRRGRSKLECFINPEIIWRSRETDEAREGCFSTGPIWGLVRRPVAVKIRAFTPSGKVVERIFEGFTARIAQHEIDHLYGIRFPDRIKNDKKRHWVHTEEMELYIKHIQQWPRHCSRERWIAFKASGQPLSTAPTPQ